MNIQRFPNGVYARGSRRFTLSSMGDGTIGIYELGSSTPVATIATCLSLPGFERTPNYMDRVDHAIYAATERDA